MQILGRIQNGVVVLEGSVALPEGARVTVLFSGPPDKPAQVKGRRLQVPIVRTGRPGSVSLSGARIAEILNEQDASS